MVILHCRFFCFITSCCATSFCHAEFLLKSQLIVLWEFPCMWLVALPLLLLRFFLSFSGHFNYSEWISLGSSCLGICASWTWISFFFPSWVKFSAFTSLTKLCDPLSLFYSRTPILQMLVCLMLFLNFLTLSSLSKILLLISFFLYSLGYFHNSVF